MLAAAIEREAGSNPEAAAIVVGRCRWTYARLAQLAGSIDEQLATKFAGEKPSRRVGVWMNEIPHLIAALSALDARGETAVVFSASTAAKTIEQRAGESALAAVLTDKHDTAVGGESLLRLAWRVPAAVGIASYNQAQHPAGQSEVILFTSGTSGAPKPAIHTWPRLAAAVRRDSKYLGKHWLMAYDAAAFAGIQVWLQALLTGGCLCLPQSREPAAVAECLVEQGVEFASATPSFWRMVVHGVSKDSLRQTRLAQVTLGGEVVDQSILDQLRSAFPAARITHIYASTEMGVCFSVSDGLAGFPASYLNDEKLACRLRINDDGELEIQSNRAMRGYLVGAGGQTSDAPAQRPTTDEGWFATGDLVELCGDRVVFVGRKSETINVGGMKVYPAEVERCIQSVQGVEQVRVRGVASSLTGQLVGAEVQPTPGTDQDILRREILATCRRQLARHQVPISIDFKVRLALNEGGKLPRRAEVRNGR